MATKIPKPKPRGYGPETRTYRGKTGTFYTVHHTRDGAFHVFVRYSMAGELEVDAKAAAVDCGGPKTGTTQQCWESLWSKP